MHDVAMRRRIAALVIAALLAISGAALTSAFFAADDQAVSNTGGSIGVAIVGTSSADQIYG